VEFSADAFFNTQGGSGSSSSSSSSSGNSGEVGDTTLAFAVKTTVGVEKPSALEAMLAEGQGNANIPARTLVFRDPSIKADFTETFKDLEKATGPFAGFIATKIPKVMYLPVGAGLGVPLPACIDKVAVQRSSSGDGEQELQVSGRVEFNQRLISDQVRGDF
jgi:hypothetical protein